MSYKLIVCDDTHSSQENGESKYISSNRRSYVGIEINPDDWETIASKIREMHDEFNLPDDLKNFHFTDMYNARGYWKENREKSNKIFEKFTELFEKYQIETFVQTIEEYTPVQGVTWPEGFLDIKKLAGNNLLDGIAFVLMVSKVLRKLKSGESACFLVEEGCLGKAGKKYACESQGIHAEFHFMNKNFELLQLADFLAFSINRIKMIALKNDMNYSDSEIFKTLYERLSIAINCKDAIKSRIDDIPHIKEQYEDMLRNDRKAKGLPALD